MLLVPLFFQLQLLYTYGHSHIDLHGHKVPRSTPQNTAKIRSTRANPPALLFTALPDSRRKAPTEDTSDSETLSRPRTPLSESPNEPANEPQTPVVIQPMAKPMRPSEYDGKTRDARTVEAWLIRMTTYLTLTNTADNRKVELASSYLAGDAFEWYIDNQTVLLVGTFDGFKTALRDRFVPQNHKSITYSQYKGLTQGNLSISEYSIKFKALADQIPDLVPPKTRDLEFVTGLYHEIKKFIVSQPSVQNETWTDLVGRALRIEETLPPGYNRLPPPPPATIVPLLRLPVLIVPLLRPPVLIVPLPWDLIPIVILLIKPSIPRAPISGSRARRPPLLLPRSSNVFLSQTGHF